MKLYFKAMYLFMFLLLPLILTAYCFYKKNTRIIPAIFLGIIVAVLVCGFRAFFLYAHRIVPFSFEKNAVYLLMRQTLLPVILVYGIFFLWSKDELSYKIESFMPLMVSFYMLYLPYNILSTSGHVFTTFPLFVKPVIFAVMLFSITLFLHCMEKCIEKKSYVFAGLWIFISIINLVIPALLETMYILDMNYALVLILSALYCVITPLAFLLCRKGIIRNK